MHEGLKQALKRAIHLRPFPFVRGGERLVPILRYHSLDPSGSAHSTSVAQWRSHLDYLEAMDVEVLTLSQALDREPGRGRPFVALTFDDGFANHAEIAAPELAARGHRATFFATADHLGGTASWLSGDIEELLDEGQDVVDGPLEPFLARARPARDFILHHVPELLARGEEACLREVHLLNAVRHLPTLDGPGLQSLVAKGMEVGAHAASHGPLAGLDEAALDHEIGDARRVLEAESGAPVKLFCHPYGPKVPGVAERLRAAGYRGGCGGARGYWDETSDPYWLPRIDMHRVFTRADLDLLLHPRNRALRKRLWGEPLTG